MNLYDAIDVIESAPGFTDETTSVGEAWATVLALLSPLQPIAISERLPGPEDCDREGRYWWLDSKDKYWYLRSWQEINFAGLRQPTHWLSAHALPLPTAND